jgi:hypothetical protein
MNTYAEQYAQLNVVSCARLRALVPPGCKTSLAGHLATPAL